VSRRLLVALMTAGFLGAVLAAAPASQAQSSTTCIGRQDVMQITPGWSLEPTTGSMVTVVDGTEECNGPVEGYQPTGPIRTRHSVTYGYVDPDTCSRFTVKGWIDRSIPTADGIVVLRVYFTGGLDPSSDPPARWGTFEGDRDSGRFWFRPIEGDCVHSPLTRVEAGWIAFFKSSHGKRSK
jgi:hypothetical protein